MTPSYAIVESGGKQYRVEKGATVLVDRLSDEEGAKVTLRPVMYRGDEKVVLERGELEKVKVEAVVAEHLRGDKIRVFKYKPKKGYRRRAGHRSELTKLEVTDVKMLTRRPAAKKKAEPKGEGKAERKGAGAEPKGEGKAEPTGERKAEPKEAATKKPAPKRPAAKKPAAKKPAAKRKSSGRGSTKPSSGSGSAKKES
jgi:large subunit ribosomal protein L21